MNLDDFKDFTPGPWEWANTGGEINLAPTDLMIYFSQGGGKEPSGADAKLIAAAPELLAECRRLTAENERLVKNAALGRRVFFAPIRH